MTNPHKPYLMQAWLSLDDIDGLLDCRFEEYDTDQPGIVHALAGNIDIGSLLSDKQAEELVTKFANSVKAERRNF